MGITQLFCCFSDKSPNCLVITGLISSFIAFSFLVWGLADLWFDRDGALAIYIIAFVFICASLVGFIVLFIILNIRKTEYSRTFYSIGKIICLIIFIICIIAFILMLTAFIILIADYTDVENDIPGQYFPSHEWTAVFLPSILALISLVIMILVANILYKIFNDNLLSNPNSVDISRNTTIGTISNQPLPIIQNAIQPAIQPAMQPVIQSVRQPQIQQTTMKPIIQTIIKPPIHITMQPEIKPTIQSSIQPTMQSIIQHPIQSENLPYIGPVEEPENNGPIRPW